VVIFKFQTAQSMQALIFTLWQTTLLQLRKKSCLSKAMLAIGWHWSPFM